MEDKNNITAKTINKFIEWAAQFSDGQYLFRGVSTENYKIEASAYRRLPEIDRNNPSKLLKINKDLIEKARSLGHDQRDGQTLSDLELLAELQHFGAATCLIDFTGSALVALWFACQQGSQTEANGKVFVVRHDDMVLLKTVNPKLITEDIDYFLKPDENGRYPLYQWQPKLQNNRIIAQQSVFVFSGAQIEAEAVGFPTAFRSSICQEKRSLLFFRAWFRVRRRLCWCRLCRYWCWLYRWLCWRIRRNGTNRFNWCWGYRTRGRIPGSFFFSSASTGVLG